MHAQLYPAIRGGRDLFLHGGDTPPEAAFLIRPGASVFAGCAHHVVQRGNNHQDVFFVDADREVY